MTKRRKTKAPAVAMDAQARADAKARAADKRRAKAASQFMAGITRRRLQYVAALLDLARAAAGMEPGFDGRPPEIVDVPEPGENPQMRVARNVCEHPLDLMAHKRQISTEQYGAGDLYRRDLEMAQISPMSGRRFESIYTVELSNAKALKEAGLDTMLGPKTFAARRAKQPLRWEDLAPLTIDAMDRANRARLFVARVAGAEAAAIAEHVCRDGLTVTDLGSTKKYGARARVGRKLQAALDALADHYGTRARRRGSIRSWGDGAHVPSLDGAGADAERASEAPAKSEMEAAE